MMKKNYLKWISETDSFWWNDSAVITEMDEEILNGATGVTTNPILISRTLHENYEDWKQLFTDITKFNAEDRTEEIIRRITVEIAKKFLPIFKKSDGKQGFVCAQVNPQFQGNVDKMVEMGRRMAKWAPNIAVKLPATLAGVEAIEELTAEGHTTVGTVSFSVPQAVEIAKRQQQGLMRARKNGVTTGQVFSVIMVGRLDDYLRDVAHDMKLDISEEDLIQAGTACVKRAYQIIRESGYESMMLPAGMRGSYQAIALSGAKLTMSLSANIKRQLKEVDDFTQHFDEQVSSKTLARLCLIPEFVRAYEPDGLSPSEFITFGATQRTLTQFIESGWLSISQFKFF